LAFAYENVVGPQHNRLDNESNGIKEAFIECKAETPDGKEKNKSFFCSACDSTNETLK